MPLTRETLKNFHLLQKLLKMLPNNIRKNIPYYKYQYLKNNQFSSVKILTDDAELDTTNSDKDFNFNEYSKAIISMINGSNQKFSVGVYGEWGTGKTTLMSLVARDLRPSIFNWQNVPGRESIILKKFLQKNFDGLNSWVNDPTLVIKKSHDRKRIILSSDNTKNPKNSLSITLVEKGKAVLEINHQKVYEFLVEIEDTSILIKENNILTVWFNAWRYEREEQFALIPLMKTIAFAMGEHPIYKDIKPILIRGLEILSKDILRNLATRYVMTEQGFKEFEEKLIPKLENLPEIDKDTIYFDGIKKVENKIQEIFQTYPTSRIVVFIDDLDRCSPETALEVFESVKVFFEIDGFIFIIGLSRGTLYKLIKAKYEKIGLTDIAPHEYIRKMIQIDINIQKWTESSIKDLINKLSDKIDKKYRKQIINNSDLIVKGVELNPRQVKRFINRFIIALNINNSLDAKKFLVGELLSNRWYDFYYYITNASFIEILNSYLKKRAEGKGEEFFRDLENKEKDKEHPINEFEKIVLSYKNDSALWDFFESYREIIFGKDTEGVIEESKVAKDWEKYQSVSGSTKYQYPPIYEAQMAKNIAFISMPFSKDLEDLYRFAIGPALQKYNILAQRIDRTFAGNNIQERIKTTIESSLLIIAEVSENNPNVSFEVGYAMALKRPILLLAKSPLKIHFDLSEQRGTSV